MKVADKTLLLAHRIIFGRPGEANKRKADLRQFNGFPVSQDKAALVKKLSAQTVAGLRDLCIMFNLERSGEKNAMAGRLADFLMNPKDFGKSKAAPPKKAAVTKKKAPAKKTATAAKGKKAKATKGKKSPELSAEFVESDDDFTEEIASLQAAGRKTNQ